MRLAFPTTALLFAALVLAVPATAQQRSGLGPCRNGVQALISAIDRGEQKSADYRDAYKGVVDSCGRSSHPVKPAKSFDKASCSRLATKLLDQLEKRYGLRSRAFAATRERFSATCAPVR
jgi:hypothetical protein